MSHGVLKRLPLVLLIAGSCLFLFFQFKPLIKCPSCFLFVNSGDGLKNYFTTAYYVARTDGLWFDGMNYPYGEHIIYTDNQPIWALMWKAVHSIIPLDAHIIGLINLQMIVGLLIGAIAIYFILRRFRLPRWYAALASVPVILLSPQIARFTGHYSLAYVCYLPIFILLVLRWLENPKKIQRAGLLIGWIVVMGFTHLYFLFIACAFLFSVGVIDLISKLIRAIDQWKTHLRTSLFLPATAIALISGMLVYAPVKLTDPVPDRPKEVYGTYVFTSNLSGLLLPWHEPFGKYWKEEYDMKVPDSEGRSYLGLMGVLFIPVLLYLLCVKKIGRRRRTGLSPPLILLTAGFLVWLLSTGWLHSLGLEKVGEVFSPLAQFRSLGRLSWIFYYVYCLSFIYYGYVLLKFAKQRGRFKWIHICLLVLTFAIWTVEGYHYFSHTTKSIYHKNETFRGSTPYLDLLAENNLSANDFQAIFQLPLVIVGPEKFVILRGSWPLRESMQCAWELDLPIIDVNMSRTSVSQSLDLLQLISEHTPQKSRLNKMSKKPLLLLADPEHATHGEQRILEFGKRLGKVKQMEVYQLSPEALKNMPQILPTGDTLQFLVFSGMPTPPIPVDGGALVTMRDDVIFSVKIADGSGFKFEFECWTYIDHLSPGMPAIIHQQLNEEGVLLKQNTYSQFSHPPSEVKGNWVKISASFNSPDKTLHYFISNTSGSTFDNALVRVRVE